MQLVAIYCQGMIPGLLPLVWSIVIMKVCLAEMQSTRKERVCVQCLSIFDTYQA